MIKVRTRIAPSPTGEDLHIGNIYTGLLNFAYAKKNSGQFIIRIEDTDRQRLVEGSEKKILATLKTFGLIYDEGPDVGGPHHPYRQSERIEKYKEFATTLVEKGHAYYCFCTKERLDKLREENLAQKKAPRYDRRCIRIQDSASQRIQKGEQYVIRLKVPENKDILFTDVIRGDIVINSKELDDQVLLKSDGYPTYHLGVVVDDHLMEITHIIRAEEWISSTPKHVLLYEFFGWELPLFAHVPLLRNTDKSKLSKRKNPVWASWYIEEGFLPEAVINFLALLGWSHPEEKEIFSLEEFIQLFDLKDVHPSGPIFDLEKLKWMNGVYIRQLSVDELKSKIKNQKSKVQIKVQNLDENLLDKLTPLAQERMQTLNDFFELTAHFFQEQDIELDEKQKEVGRELLQELEEVTDWKQDDILLGLKKILEQEKIRMPVLYKILTGKEKGLPLPESLEILGKEETLSRLRQIT